jgi:hypothetical protein
VFFGSGSGSAIIFELDLNPDPRGQKRLTKIEIVKKFSSFEVLAGCSLLRTELLL